MLRTRVKDRTPAGVGESAKTRDERFDFEWCGADDEDAQSYFFVEGLRMLTPP
jgi:hypothetical protein